MPFLFIRQAFNLFALGCKLDFLFARGDSFDELFDLLALEHKHEDDHKDGEICAEESAVIEEGIKILSHSVGRPLTPNVNSG